MRRGVVLATIGLVASVLGILGFFGVRSYQDLSPGPSSTRSTAVRTSAVDPDAGRWQVVRRADDACAVATRRSKELSALTGAKRFLAWVRKVAELRALLLKQWKSVSARSAAVPESFVAEVHKLLRDVEMANWWWGEVVRHSAANSWDRARTVFAEYRRFDDSAVDRANKLGFSVCNYPWPRPIGW